jgi:hypothetical protein
MSEEDTPSEKVTNRPKKQLTPKERHFVKIMADTGMGGIEAARIAFQWRCEPGSSESQKAKDLARSPRVKEAMAELEGKVVRETQAQIDLKQEFGELNRGKLRDYAFKVLKSVRDNPQSKAATRYNAIKILKKLHDPGKDVNLIWQWMDIAWRYQTAHCPCCHKSFALSAVKNSGLDKWRIAAKKAPLKKHLPEKALQLMELIKLADKRRTPHAGQIKALAAPERHIIGLGAARAGKSYLLALFAILAVCLPGVEIWILGETYDRTVSEVEYIQKFLNAIFYPHFDAFFNVSSDKKTGELTMTTKWGSMIKVKSAKAKGSITARAVELALCAEPGWLPADIYEEIRARMSERLGRIIALGTPKGVGAFVGRMSNMTGRDPDTGKIIRWKPEERLIKNGAPWGVSMLKMNLSPTDNPEYVKEELKSARMELTDEEYASEFEGIGVAAEGLKFAEIKDRHLQNLPENFFDKAVFVLGCDQGPKNFGACLVAFDGHRAVTCWEYFNGDTTTMKRNLARLRAKVPKWIHTLGGNSANWKLTITDIDPPLYGAFEELEEEGHRWPTEIITRHRNNARMGDNWRRENQEFINGMARRDRMIFHDSHVRVIDDDESPGGEAMHDQTMQVVDRPDNPDKESKGGSDKGWQVSDPWRSDHVLDAWYFCMWAIFIEELRVPSTFGRPIDTDDPWGDQKAAFDYTREMQERSELRGHKDGPSNSRDIFQNAFGYRGLSRGGLAGGKGNYGNES